LRNLARQALSLNPIPFGDHRIDEWHQGCAAHLMGLANMLFAWAIGERADTTASAPKRDCLA